jgi:exopolysaccharide biosynthesis polyprenyl glycosylphosphotransferase
MNFQTRSREERAVYIHFDTLWGGSIMGKKYKSTPGLAALDMAALVLAYIIGYYVRFRTLEGIFEEQLYRIGIVCLLLIYLCVALQTDFLKDLVERDYAKEIFLVFRINCILAVFMALLLYFLHIAGDYSRMFYGVIFVADICLMGSFRCLCKKLLRNYYKADKFSLRFLILTNGALAEQVYGELTECVPADYRLDGMVLLDDRKDALPGKLKDMVVAVRENMYDYIRQQVIDEVFISVNNCPVHEIEDVILTLQHMGIVVNVNIQTFGLKTKEKALREFGQHSVLTYSTNMFDSTSLFLKRGMDIIGSLVGLFFTAVLTIIVGPLIFLESPGPVFFSQVRIGKNGRRFKIYKFRSMYVDAEKRKEELMEHNEMCGHMFKMANDPRVTKVGEFIRKTSIDEFPQFYNVLKGDMSLVGTRPPTEDEFLHYTNEQKRRLSLKPGITGLWQVSGRSDITDFDEVVKLDLQYIDHWSIWQDIKIVGKTVVMVLRGSGAR